MSNNSSVEIEALAASIGENVYIDVAKWHLYLSDAHLHTVLAEKIYTQLEIHDSLTENQLLEILGEIKVKLGGGKKELPLTDLIPMQSQLRLLDLVEEYQKDR